MARCVCGSTIERLEGTETWIREGTTSADGLAGEVHCRQAASNIHWPVCMVVVSEVVLADHPHLLPGEWGWCDWCSTPAAYQVGNDLACREHVGPMAAVHIERQGPQTVA